MAARWLDRTTTAEEIAWDAERIRLIGTPLPWLRANAPGEEALREVSWLPVADTLVPDGDRRAPAV